MDWRAFLDKTLQKYDGWIAEGKIANTSKVIPVGESLSAHQWVMPTEQVLHYLRNARSFALAPCRCRTLGGHCDRPRETCFALNDIADTWVKIGYAQRVSLEEAEAQAKLANEAGLVPMTLLDPLQDVMTVCHCCPCCCHDLQFWSQRDRKDLVAHSHYQAVQDDDQCLHCGACVERCHFQARVWDGDQVRYDPDQCYGCGLCVTTCPSQAISMVLRDPRQRAVNL